MSLPDAPRIEEAIGLIEMIQLERICPQGGIDLAQFFLENYFTSM